MFKMGLTRSVVAVALVTSAAFFPAVADGHMGDNIKAAVENTGRPETDTKRDGDRKPAEVLSFVAVKPGMTVVDINSGGGYYTEMLSYAVGKEGKVYAHNGPLYWSFVKNNVGKRYDGRLSNVVQLHDETEKVNVPEGSVDLAITVLAFHDYYFLPEGVKKVADVPAILSSIHKSLKDDGSLVVIDHVAPAGTGSTAGNTTHRIDPEFVKAQIIAAGFKLVDTSKVLANDSDDRSKGVFDPGIQGKTDRFIYRFVK